MFRLWGKIFTDNRMEKDHVATDGDYSNIDDFAYRGKVRFNADNFIEQIDFDYLEIQIIEE